MNFYSSSLAHMQDSGTCLSMREMLQLIKRTTTRVHLSIDAVLENNHEIHAEHFDVQLRIVRDVSDYNSLFLVVHGETLLPMCWRWNLIGTLILKN